MASFNKISDGVNAAIQMQLETAQYNLNNPELPLHLKIGLNAGELIAEDNDLFGTVVQLAARIVDKASADQIYISEIVHGLCAGKKYQITDRGGFEMKGFDSAVNVFEVIWNNGEGEAPDSAPSQAATAETGTAEGAGPATPAATETASPAPTAPEVPPAPTASETALAAPAAPSAEPAPAEPSPEGTKDNTPSSD